MTFSRVAAARLWRRVAVASSVMAAACPTPAAGEGPFQVEPHEASYDAIVVDVAPDVGVAGGEGTLTAKIETTCAGVTASQRLFARIDATDAPPALAELQARYQETVDGRALRFEKINAFNGALLRREAGGARRDPFEGRIRVDYQEPAGARAEGPIDALFPQAFRDRILAAALARRSRLDAVVFDGAVGGAFLSASVSIGAPLERGVGARFTDHASLRGLKAWPIHIHYEPMSDLRGSEDGDAFEYAYNLYENGVLDRLEIDFGRFRIEARLSLIEYGERPRDCGSAG